MDVSPWQFKTGPSVWCLYSTNTRHKADQNPLDTMGLYWMVLASAETWSAQIKYLEPKWPLFLKVNPAKQGLFKPKLGSFGFQVPMVFCCLIHWYFPNNLILIVERRISLPNHHFRDHVGFRFECICSLYLPYLLGRPHERAKDIPDWYEVLEVLPGLDGHDMASLWRSFTNSSLFQGFFGKLHFPSNRQFPRALYKRDIYKGFSLPWSKPFWISLDDWFPAKAVLQQHSWIRFATVHRENIFLAPRPDGNGASKKPPHGGWVRTLMVEIGSYVSILYVNTYGCFRK